MFSVDPVDTAMQTAGLAGAEIAATLARHGVKATLCGRRKRHKSASSVD